MARILVGQGGVKIHAGGPLSDQNGTDCCCGPPPPTCGDCASCPDNIAIVLNYGVEYSCSGGGQETENTVGTVLLTRLAGCQYTPISASGNVEFVEAGETVPLALSLGTPTIGLACYLDPYLPPAQGGPPYPMPPGLPAGPGYFVDVLLRCGQQQCFLAAPLVQAWGPLVGCMTESSYTLLTPAAGQPVPPDCTILVVNPASVVVS